MTRPNIDTVYRAHKSYVCRAKSLKQRKAGSSPKLSFFKPIYCKTDIFSHDFMFANHVFFNAKP